MPHPPDHSFAVLADLDAGRENNFNLIRMAAAVAVLVSHAWPITLGMRVPEPLEASTGYTLGAIAVMIFFAISGYLVTRSFARRADPGRWLLARAARLFPALAVALVLSAAVLGPLATGLSPAAYFAHPETLAYAPRNLLLADPQYKLPGVFETHPMGAVNGSLWTLFHEAACYGGVLALGLLGVLRRRGRMAAALAAFALVYAGLCLPALRDLAPDKLVRLAQLAVPFAIGTAFYVWRDRLVLHPGVLAPLLLLVVAARDTPAYHPLFALWVSYAVFLLALLPKGRILRYNAVGDYSYGTYIYAFPAQQLAFAATGAASPALNVALALPVTLALALLSWNWVERPALDRLRPRPGRAPARVRRSPARRAAMAGAERS